MRRTHTCGEPRLADQGQPCLLQGWVHRRRDHGGVIFLDLRDRYGVVQAVLNPQLAPEAHEAAHDVRAEWVVEVEAKSRRAHPAPRIRGCRRARWSCRSSAWRCSTPR